MAFFTVDQRNGHWWFITPESEPFFSIGMNHIDSATLRYPESNDVFQLKYNNSEQVWIQQAVTPDLQAWGFNCIGWVQEVVTRGPTNHRHSRSFTFEEYQWANMPYCHLLPFTETHQWERETRYPDVFHSEFEDWCDFVTRKDCAQMVNDPKLIGYFYVDCPSWVHTHQENPKGPWFDPEKLKTEAGRKELSRMAERYYKVTHDAIRRYDPNHLILGDRYEGKAPLPEEVWRAALPYIDVMSFQYFAPVDVVAPDFERWHKLTGKPVLLADASVPKRKPEAYDPMMQILRELPCCVGWHICGAYLQNRCRNYGFKDERDEIIAPIVTAVSKTNHETLDWVASVTS